MFRALRAAVLSRRPVAGATGHHHTTTGPRTTATATTTQVGGTLLSVAAVRRNSCNSSRRVMAKCCLPVTVFYQSRGLNRLLRVSYAQFGSNLKIGCAVRLPPADRPRYPVKHAAWGYWNSPHDVIDLYRNSSSGRREVLCYACRPVPRLQDRRFSRTGLRLRAGSWATWT